MDKEKVKVLLIEDDEDDYVLFKQRIQKSASYNFTVDWISSLSDALTHLIKNTHDVYFVDYRLGKQNGLDLIRKARSEGSSKPIILLTGQGASELGIEAIREGADDYLLKGELTTYLLERSIGYARERRFHTEQALKRSEERFLDLADNMSQFAWMADEKGNIYWYNKRWFEYTGSTPDEMKGWGWKKVHHPDHLSRVTEKLSYSFKTGEEWEDTFPLRRKDGQYRWFLSRAKPIKDENGKVLRWFGTHTDITQLRKLEKQKDEFLGVASHELKTPVTSIKAYTQVLQQHFRNKEDMKAVELLSKMDSQINKLTTLIIDLLDVTKMEAGKITFNEDYFDFNELVNEVVEEIQRTAPRHKIDKKLSRTKTIYGDRDRTGQVITNFLTNAIKYSPESDKVIVKTEIDHDTVEFCVRDFGIGIPEEKQKQLFERFYRAGKDEKNTYAGLGLGLYISKEIIQRQGGKVWFESTVGKGSTFCFSMSVQKGISKKNSESLGNERITNE